MLPFPSQFLHTSPTYSIFEAYEINGLPRMNSTFTEAAAAAFSLNIALALVLWRFLERAESLRNIVCAAVIGVGLLLTISTTGYVCLIFLLFVATLRYLAPWKGALRFAPCQSAASRSRMFSRLGLGRCLRRQRRLRESRAHRAARQDGHQLLQNRTTWNNDALKTAVDTYGIGAGWGVCRASSFVPTLLGNCGVPGSLLFFAFYWRLMRPAVRLNSLPIQTHGAVLFALAAVLLDLIVSAPEVANPMIWLLFAVAAKLAAGRASRSAYRVPMLTFEAAAS